MSSEPPDYLRHMLIEVDYLIRGSKGLSYESFVADETLCRAFVRSLEIIGAAIPAPVRPTNPGRIVQLRGRVLMPLAPRHLGDATGSDGLRSDDGRQPSRAPRPRCGAGRRRGWMGCSRPS